MDVLHCKTPTMIQKEIVIFMIVHNLLRSLMLEVQHRGLIPIEEVSFTGTLSTLRQWLPLWNSPEREPMEGMLRAIEDDPLILRPGRVEPRAIKRRMKTYQLLTKPRGVFREIQHRHKYKKAA